MSEKVIELEKGKYKSFEILSILIHFYNNKYILEKVLNGVSRETFRFEKINRQNPYNHTQVYYLDNYNIETAINDFNNNFYRYHPNSILKTSFIFKYDEQPVFMSYQYDNNEDLKMTLIGTGGKYQSYVKDKDEEALSIKAQNTLIQKFAFYEEHSHRIRSSLVNLDSSINTIYRFKKYIDSIIKFPKEKIIESFKQLRSCVEEHMDDSKIYTMNKTITLRKSNKYLSLHILKVAQKNVYIYDSALDRGFFEIFIPMFEQLGGVNELKNIILKQRLMEE